MIDPVEFRRINDAQVEPVGVRSGRVHGAPIHLATLTMALDAMLSVLPFAIAEKLDVGAVHEQVQRPIGTLVAEQQ